MAIDLKPYFDAARVADDEVQRIMAEMHAAFSTGTEEGKAKALELRPSLDAAKKSALEANNLYISMRNASAESGNVAKNFVPVSPNPEDSPAAKVMTRVAFEALDMFARMKYIKSGGQVVDEQPVA